MRVDRPCRGVSWGAPRRLARALATACLVVAAACASPGVPPIQHVVLLELEDAAQAEALLHDCDALLKDIPSVMSYHAGRHLETGRAAVLDAYDVGLVIGLEDEQGYRAYLEHPAHLELLERWASSFESLAIYDILDAPP